MPRQVPDRWRLTRAGIVNVWHYLENTFDVSGGRMILRGTNGSGKSRALEMLLPFLLDADRRKMDATGSGRVNLDELMRTGAGEQTNRSGYLWLELQGPDSWLTIGALLQYSRSANRTQVWYFMTPLRVGHEIHLLNAQREPLSRKELTELIGAEQGSESAETHRERIRSTVFGLSGDSGRDRYLGLLQLLHTLRSPDVGNRIDEGRLPQILSDALPPLDEQTLSRAGEQLDGLTATREAQQRLEQSHEQVQRLLGVYRRYAATTILDTAAQTLYQVEELAAAERVETECRQTHDRLRTDLAAKRAEEEQLQSDVAELQNAINGIQGRAIFKQADDLVQRDNTVASFARATDQVLAEAERERAHCRTAVRSTDQRFTELDEAVGAAAALLARTRRALDAADLSHSALPDGIGLTEQQPVSQTAVIRTTRDQPPQPIERPMARQATTWPTDARTSEAGVRAVIEAAHRRRELAHARLLEARRLSVEEQKVRAAEADATRAEQQAENDVAQADIDETSRDERAIELITAWRSWSADPDTAALLGDIDWAADPVLGPLLLDADALTGDESTDSDPLELQRIDDSAARLAQPVRDVLAATRAELAAAQRTDDSVRSALGVEAAALRRAEDPQPPQAPWLSTRAAIPFWQTIDFVDDLPDADRAGVEGALLAAGLLTAGLELDGTVRAADGTALIRPRTTPAARPLTAALRPDPAGTTTPELVLSVLTGIGLDDDSPTSVSTDGSWRNGPLRGRHVVPAARHIGAAARAQARRDRLEAIDAELAELDARALARRTERSELDERQQRLDTHLATTPRTAQLSGARLVARASVRRAERSRAAALVAVASAREARTRWAKQGETHRLACAHHALPSETGPLEGVVSAAGEAERYATTLLESLRRLTACVERHQQALADVGEAVRRRDEAEARADGQWRTWRDLAAEVGALHEAIELDVEQARAELARSQQAHEQARTKAHRARDDLSVLAPKVGQAEAEARQAATEAARRLDDMIDAAGIFSRRITLPGLVAAVTDQALGPVERPEQSASVRAAAEAAVSRVAKPAQPATANSVFTAFQSFDREVSGQLDASHQLQDGISLIAVLGAGDDHTLAGVSAALQERVVTGRAALSEREREVFTTFVLGGVAEELRRRINQAVALVAAMNGSLREIRTSNGIGVRLGWKLRDDASELRRIAELVATADAVRTAEQNDDLTNLLRRRVEEFYASDPSSGYAVHLAAALDYRRWHEVDVTILGPQAGQERRISTRAKLSQGETRFVSYVTLFAAADAYLTGLSTDQRQLRLILLDDAFAKVDDPTIGELMGLLVHLDLDFVMTGHALWGCFAQVPQLDVYEVRRLPGTSAVTTHVHWDGHTRHLRSTA